MTLQICAACFSLNIPEHFCKKCGQRLHSASLETNDNTIVSHAIKMINEGKLTEAEGLVADQLKNGIPDDQLQLIAEQIKLIRETESRARTIANFAFQYYQEQNFQMAHEAIMEALSIFPAPDLKDLESAIRIGAEEVKMQQQGDAKLTHAQNLLNNRNPSGAFDIMSKLIVEFPENPIYKEYYEKALFAYAEEMRDMIQALIRQGQYAEAENRLLAMRSICNDERINHFMNPLEMELNNKKKKKQRVKNIILSSIILIVIITGGYVGIYYLHWRNDKAVWESIQQDNTILGYQRFIQQYPNNRFVEEARKTLDELTKKDQQAWDNVLMNNDKASIQSYISLMSKHEGVHLQEARNRMDSIEWVAAKKSKDLNTIKAYMSNYPGSHREEAIELLSETLKEIVRPMIRDFLAKMSDENVKEVMKYFAEVTPVFKDQNDISSLDLYEYLKAEFLPEGKITYKPDLSAIDIIEDENNEQNYMITRFPVTISGNTSFPANDEGPKNDSLPKPGVSNMKIIFNQGGKITTYQVH